MRSLLQTVERSVRERGLLRDGQGVLVAVSGGLDSMVLLQLLARLQPRHGWRLAVAHFNHQLRGRHSAADARFVAQAASEMGLPCHVGAGDVRRFARREKLSLEQAARRLRHQFLAATAKRLKLPTIALAHHADDQVELFFVRLFRGAGGGGLAGMKWLGPSPADASVELIRPLLAVPKRALSEFARRAKVRFREDATNRQTDILRNRIRHGLLPQLRRHYQPAIASVVARVMDLTGAESDLAAAAAERWRHGRRTPFAALPVAVQRSHVCAECLRLGIAPDFALVEALRQRPGKAVTAARGVALRLDDRGRLGRVVRERAPAPATLDVRLDGRSGRGRFAGLTFEWQRLAGGRLPKRQPGVEHFDAGRVGGRIRLRHWRPGDRFQPIGLVAAVKLQDLFTNAKVPRAERSRRIVAEAADGAVFWVEGLRIGEACKVTPATRSRWRWQWRRAKS